MAKRNRMTGLALETQRLRIFALSPEQLSLYTKPDCLLEKELGLSPKPRTIAPELYEAVEHVLLPAAMDKGKNYLFSTLWSIILKEQKVLVGDICFKGPPNEKGEIEIGYGTYDEFQQKGYMTEAVSAVISCVWQYPNVMAVIAETEKANIPSQKILIKNGFSLYHSVGDMIWWRLDKP